MFSYKYCEIFKNTFFIEHLWWLILQYLEIFMKTYFRGPSWHFRRFAKWWGKIMDRNTLYKLQTNHIPQIFKGYLPQILLCPFLNTLSHIILKYWHIEYFFLFCCCRKMLTMMEINQIPAIQKAIVTNLLTNTVKVLLVKKNNTFRLLSCHLVSEGWFN